jgi:hypothetical protein
VSRRPSFFSKSDLATARVSLARHYTEALFRFAISADGTASAKSYA